MGSQMSGDARARRRGGTGYRDPMVNKDTPSVGDKGDARYQELVKKSLPELLAIVAASGWMVNNLFQVTNSGWRANLRFIMQSRDEVRTYFHEFSDAGSAEEAMASAIWNMEQRRNDATRAIGVQNIDTQWDAKLPPPVAGARNIAGPYADPRHRPDEVVYIDGWKPEIEREMQATAVAVADLRRALRRWGGL